MRRPYSLFFALAFAGPAFAASSAPGTSVEMPFLIAPMSQDGKLLGYAYISSRLIASSPGAAIDVREKLAFIQDAFVRDVNAGPISRADNPIAVDTGLLNQRLTADARRIVGDSKIVTMDFTDAQGKNEIQFAPLHPKETPQLSAGPRDIETPPASPGG